MRCLYINRANIKLCKLSFYLSWVISWANMRSCYFRCHSATVMFRYYIISAMVSVFKSIKSSFVFVWYYFIYYNNTSPTLKFLISFCLCLVGAPWTIIKSFNSRSAWKHARCSHYLHCNIFLWLGRYSTVHLYCNGWVVSHRYRLTSCWILKAAWGLFEVVKGDLLRIYVSLCICFSSNNAGCSNSTS